MAISASVDPKAEYALSRYDRMRSIRAPFEQDWNDVRLFVRPVSVYITNTSQPLQYYSVMPETCFDSTAPQALEQLACAIHSYLSNPTERWFELQVEGDNPWKQDSQVTEWLQTVSDIIYAHYTREGSMLNSSLHEAYMDLGSFGTCCINQEWDNDAQGLKFKALPLPLTYFMEDKDGKVNCVCRKFSWTIRQIMEEFPDDELPPKISEMRKDMDRQLDLIQLIFPRDEYMPRVKGKIGPKNMKYASLWVCITTAELLRESGYDTFPCAVPRWTKLAGEVYGRGPCKTCLPDIKMLNAMEKTMLKAGQKAVDPPLVLTNDSFLLPIKTSPGSLIFREDETAKVEPLEVTRNLEWGEEKCKQKRDSINQAFYADWIKMEKENVEMTAYEVQDRRDEKLRLLSPIFGRITGELQGPMIIRSYNLLLEHGKIPPFPVPSKGIKLKIGYLSPAAMAQIGSKAMTMSRFMQDLMPLMQINPNIMDAVDLDKMVATLAIARGVPRSILRSMQEIQEKRQQSAQAQQMQQMSQVAEPASKAVKNLADASSKSPELASALQGAQQ